MAGDDGVDVALRDGRGAILARVRVDAGEVTVDPPEAEADPFVAAAVAAMRRSIARPRLRPACAAEPRPPG